MKSKKASINPINNDDKHFQYAASFALNPKEIGKNWQRISKIKPYINKYNWEGVHYPPVKGDLKKNWKK